MSEQTYNQPNGATGQANPDVSSGNVSGSQEQSGNEAFITKREFEAYQRQVQSQTDKAIHNSVESRLKQVKTELDIALQANKAAGIEMTPEQERALRQQMTDRALFADEPPASTQGQGQQSQDANAWITEAADDIMEEYNVHLTVRELQQIQTANPADYLRKVREMARQKSAGRGNAPQQTTPANTPPPDTRTFLGSSVGTPPTPQTQDTLREAYLKEVKDFKAANPRASVEQLYNIREKWMDKGWSGM